MKNKLHFLLVAMTAILLGATGCSFFEDPGPAPEPSEPPLAGFTIYPPVIIADETSVKFTNTSQGDISSYYWSFESGLKSSTQKSPSYTFQYEGQREVELTVHGPEQSDSKTALVPVHAMDPNCNNYENGATYSTNRIKSLRNNNQVKSGKVKFKNNYNTTLDVLLFSPDEWLDGNYKPKYFYSIESGGEGLLTVNGSQYAYSNEWGIRIQGTNGTISCVRTLGSAAQSFNNNEYYVKATDVMEGY